MVLNENEGGVKIQGRRINNLRFADDIDLIEENRERRQESLTQLTEAGEKTGLEINISKTKTMVNGRKDTEEEQLSIKNKMIENITELVYLGSLITEDNDGRLREELQGQQELWNSLKRSGETRILAREPNLKKLKATVMSVVMYASETWTLKKKDRDRLLVFKMKCYRRILRIRWEQKIMKKCTEECNAGRTSYWIMERKLNLFGHICRMKDNRLVKEVMFGTMEGELRRGRPCREWLDDMGGEKIHILNRKAQDHGTWRTVVRTALDTYGRWVHGAMKDEWIW